MAPILINRAPWNALVDDPGNNLEGTPWTKDQIKTVLLDPIDVALADVDDGTTKDANQDTQIAANTAALNVLTGSIVFDNTSGVKNDYSFGPRSANRTVMWAGAADLTLSGVTGGAAGDILTIKNTNGTGGRTIFIPHLSAASAAASRFYNAATSAPTPIGPMGWCTYVYHGSSWILVDHEPGHLITAPFNAANFAAGQGGPWTVAAGNVTQFGYELRGLMMTVCFSIELTTIGAGCVNLYLVNPLYGGFQGRNLGPTQYQCWYLPTGSAVYETCLAFMTPVLGNSDRLVIARMNNAAFAVGANNSFYGGFRFPIV